MSRAVRHTPIAPVESSGAYMVERAASLSGVPSRTVHDWARKGLIVPSVSPERIKLWSYGDLLALRLVYWLRHEKTLDGRTIKAAPMSAVKRALDQLWGLDPEQWSDAIAVDQGGDIVLNPDVAPVSVEGQSFIASELLGLIRAFDTPAGTHGPDLHVPRPNLRIVPGKLAGEPHVAQSRIETQALAALARRGMPNLRIVTLYPELDAGAVGEAIALERQLERNLSVAAA